MSLVSVSSEWIMGMNELQVKPFINIQLFHESYLLIDLVALEKSLFEDIHQSLYCNEHGG